MNLKLERTGSRELIKEEERLAEGFIPLQLR